VIKFNGIEMLPLYSSYYSVAVRLKEIKVKLAVIVKLAKILTTTRK